MHFAGAFRRDVPKFSLGPIQSKENMRKLLSNKNLAIHMGVSKNRGKTPKMDGL